MTTKEVENSGQFQKGHEKKGGRKKGTPNKTTALIKDAIIQAAEKAGGKEGMVGYLKKQADKNPNAFMGLLGKVLPTQLEGTDNPIQTITKVTLVAKVDERNPD